MKFKAKSLMSFRRLFSSSAFSFVVNLVTKAAASVAVAAATVCAGLASAAPTNLTPDSQPASASLRTTLSSGAPASQTTGVIEAGWNMSLMGESFADEKEHAQIAGLELGGKIRYGLLPSLEMKADAGVALESGYAQSRFGDNTPQTGLNLHEALVQYHPGANEWSHIVLQAGAINQAHLNSPLLVSAQAFPAVLESVRMGSKDLNLELKAQQAVPTSSTLSTKTVEAEGTPSFLTEGLDMNAKLGSRVSLDVFGFHYAFSGLPSTVATQSELFGNTVTEVTAKQDAFTYAFDGISYGSGLKVHLSRELVWILDGQVVQNLKAPDRSNLGELISSGFAIALPGDVDLKPTAELFAAESDIAPGFYNGSDRGHNNRSGWAADVAATFKKAGFRVGGRFVHSDLINPSLVQTTESFIMLRFETLYAIF